jgi:hypothetical protein
MEDESRPMAVSSVTIPAMDTFAVGRYVELYPTGRRQHR